jgi:hypothetical protein
MNAEFEAFLAELLATTLVLDDGTKLKPIYLEWDDLNSEERDLALGKIKQMIIEEVKKLRAGEKLRLEFSSIPDDLDEMLTSVAGKGSSEVEWTELDQS